MNAPACIYFSFKINVYFRGLFQQITSFRTPSILIFFLLGVCFRLITLFRTPSSFIFFLLGVHFRLITPFHSPCSFIFFLLGVHFHLITPSSPSLNLTRHPIPHGTMNFPCKTPSPGAVAPALYFNLPEYPSLFEYVCCTGENVPIKQKKPARTLSQEFPDRGLLLLIIS